MKTVMKNRKLKKHMVKLFTITAGLNISENEPLQQRLKNLYEGIKKLQKLADVVHACRYYGAALRDIDQILGVVKEKPQGPYEIDVLKKKFAACEHIYAEIYRDIYYTLQTGMMFNACVFAKWSCLCAAVAAIAACIGIVLSW